MRLWRRRHPSPIEPQDRFHGLSYIDFKRLSTYNGERARGIMHTPEWQASMAILQRRYDAAQYARAIQSELSIE